jgi:hypothetical protein
MTAADSTRNVLGDNTPPVNDTGSDYAEELWNAVAADQAGSEQGTGELADSNPATVPPFCDNCGHYEAEDSESRYCVGCRPFMRALAYEE